MYMHDEPVCACVHTALYPVLQSFKCCAVMCCAVVCHTLLCPAVLCYAMPCCAVLAVVAQATAAM